MEKAECGQEGKRGEGGEGEEGDWEEGQFKLVFDRQMYYI